MNKNSENPKVGKEFENATLKWAEKYFDCGFDMEKAVEIGNPPKAHRFDLVSKDESIIIECKCYTWTKSGNVPSAKLATLDEAILYLRSVSYPAKKIIVMRMAQNEKRKMTLAEYFYEKKGHLLGDVALWELNDYGDCKLIYEGELQIRP